MKILKLCTPLSTLAIARLTQMAEFLEDLDSKVAPMDDPINQDDLNIPKGFNLTEWDCETAACAVGWAAGSGKFEGLWLSGDENNRQPTCLHEGSPKRGALGWVATGIYFDLVGVRAMVKAERDDVDFGYSEGIPHGEAVMHVLFSAGSYRDLPTPGDVAQRIRHLLTLEAK